MKSMTMDSLEKQIWPTIKNQLSQYRTITDNVVKLVDAGNYDEAVKQYQQIPVIRDAMIANIDKVININIDSAKTDNLNNNSIYLNSDNIMTILMIVGLLLAIGIGLLISKDINTPLVKIVDFAENLAGFDLSNNCKLQEKMNLVKQVEHLQKLRKILKNL